MKRKIIKIDEDKCDGCGLCADACHESAIAVVNGKAKLVRDDYCDGLGACLPICPTGAISFDEREAAAFDEAAVKANQAEKETEKPLPCGCPGSNARAIGHSTIKREVEPAGVISELCQWPVQIQLVPSGAPYFDNAHLLIAADCSAYARGDFHNRFMKNKITVIGCPKLDGVDYSEKLTKIITNNNVKSVTIVRMEVPCCGGLEHAAAAALKNSGKFIPWQVVTLSANGEILEA
ncbi:MAG: 4Fe-4S binding protein [Firmicutes bacterium]|nr:4Fe-4S binding protein [Bacillota bacterium]